MQNGSYTDPSPDNNNLIYTRPDPTHHDLGWGRQSLLIGYRE